MLPNDVGTDTLERVLFHECGHAAVARTLGGFIKYITVGWDAEDRKWHGESSISHPADPSDIASIYMAGPLAEVRYVANVFDSDREWHLSLEQVDLVPWVQRGPVEPTSVRCECGEQMKDVRCLRGMFSDDWSELLKICNAVPLDYPTELQKAIALMNRVEVWRAVAGMCAEILLRVPPKNLIWHVEFTEEKPGFNRMIDKIVNPPAA